MTSGARKILEDALSLPEDERESIANALITSLGKTPAEVEQAWADEVVRRLGQEARCEVTAISWDEAKRQIMAAHGFE